MNSATNRVEDHEPFQQIWPTDFPDKQKGMRRWIGFRAIWDPNKLSKKTGQKGDWSKKPYSAKDGSPIGPIKANQAHFLTFEEALEGAHKFGLDGIGFVFLAEDGFVGIDLDNSRHEDGTLKRNVVAIMSWFGANPYSEKSLSRTGDHLFCEGTIPHAITKTDLKDCEGVSIEVYSNGRFFAVTGLGYKTEIKDCQQEIKKLYSFLNVREDENDKNRDTRAMKTETARKFYADNLQALRDSRQGEGNTNLNLAAYFAGRAYAAGALEKTEEEIKQEILDVVLKEWQHPHPERSAHGTFASGWNRGLEHPVTIYDPEKAHVEALEHIDAILADEKALVEVKAVLREASLLDDLEYETRRKPLASRLGFRTNTLDDEVLKLRKKSDDTSNLRGQAVTMKELDPWPDPVDGAKLLAEMSAFLLRFIVFQEKADADVVSLWCLGTHCADAFNIFPRLGVVSPGSECGKSSLLDVIVRFVARGMMTSNLTTATCFRVIEEFHPTLVVDEFDTFVHDLPDLVGVLNSGHKKGEFVFRCVGDSQDLRMFSTFGPMCYGMIGRPTETLMNRSILIRMLRKSAKEKVQDLNPEERPELLEELSRMCRQAARWAKDNAKSVQACAPDTANLTNRARDNWRGLLKIAEVAGGDWPERVFRAAKIPPPRRKMSFEVRLLSDIRDIFKTRDVEQIPSTVLVSDLLAQPDSPWNRYHNGREPLDACDLADLLDSFDIGPRLLSLTEKEQMELFKATGKDLRVKRGYKKEQFTKYFEKFLTNDTSVTETSTDQAVNF